MHVRFSTSRNNQTREDCCNLHVRQCDIRYQIHILLLVAEFLRIRLTDLLTSRDLGSEAFTAAMRAEQKHQNLLHRDLDKTMWNLLTIGHTVIRRRGAPVVASMSVTWKCGLFSFRNASGGRLGGSVGWASDSWPQLRSWLSSEFKPHSGLHVGHGAYLK